MPTAVLQPELWDIQKIRDDIIEQQFKVFIWDRSEEKLSKADSLAESERI